LIDYKRGKISVVDRERLEARSCECYWIITRYYNCLLTSNY
jgi:hypothetical protein